MELYSLEVLEVSGYNDGSYEDADSFNILYGVFSTIEKAKEYAEKMMERSRKNTMETFKVIEDWYESNGQILKEVFFEEGHNHEINETYSISKISVDPEFKEEK